MGFSGNGSRKGGAVAGRQLPPGRTMSVKSAGVPESTRNAERVLMSVECHIRAEGVGMKACSQQ